MGIRPYYVGINKDLNEVLILETPPNLSSTEDTQESYLVGIKKSLQEFQIWQKTSLKRQVDQMSKGIKISFII